MLLVRVQQLQVLEQTVRRRFEEDMAQHVRTRFPGAAFTKDDRSLRKFVLESIQIARGFGVDLEYDLRRFIEFRAEYGEDFPRLAWASEILHDKSLSGCGKMERIDDYSLYVLR